jgi:hypothetical protein
MFEESILSLQRVKMCEIEVIVVCKKDREELEQAKNSRSSIHYSRNKERR